jgi:flavodoxin
MKIHFLYGTETGTSEMLCEDMQDDLGGAFETELTNMGEMDPANLDADTFYIVVTSTYGNGDLPQTAVPFLDNLEANNPDLSHVRFAIFGLGDMVFDQTFNNGSQQVMDKLIALGATMVGERGIYDASTAEPPEDLGVPWFQGITATLKDQAA